MSCFDGFCMTVLLRFCEPCIKCDLFNPFSVLLSEKNSSFQQFDPTSIATFKVQL